MQSRELLLSQNKTKSSTSLDDGMLKTPNVTVKVDNIYNVTSRWVTDYYKILEYVILKLEMTGKMDCSPYICRGQMSDVLKTDQLQVSEAS